MAMAKGWSLCSLLILVIFSCISSSESRAIGIDRDLPNMWCITNPTANPANVQKVMDLLCGGSVDCSSIQPGGACYQPNTILDHASVVFNKYYKARGSEKSTCNFGGDAMVVFNDPSYGSCIFD